MAHLARMVAASHDRRRCASGACLTRRDLPLPRYESAGAAGMDLMRSRTSSRWCCGRLERALVPTGLVLAAGAGVRGAGPAALRPRPQARHHGAEHARHHRRGLSRRGAGAFWSISGAEPFTVTRGMRIAQMVVAPVTDGRRSSRSMSVDETVPAPQAVSVRPGLVRGDRDMNLLSRRSLLAIAAVTDIALHARPQPVSAKALAARHKLPPRHLEPVLQALVRHGILKGVRGPRGGYELARERRRITAGDIVRAAMTARPRHRLAADPESKLAERVVGPLGRPGRPAAFLAELDGVTVDDLCAQAQAVAARWTTSPTADFTI